MPWMISGWPLPPGASRSAGECLPRSPQRLHAFFVARFATRVRELAGVPKKKTATRRMRCAAPGAALRCASTPQARLASAARAWRRCKRRFRGDEAAIIVEKSPAEAGPSP